MKAGDDKTVALCFECHLGGSGVHLNGPEGHWLSQRGIDGKALAEALWTLSGDRTAALEAIGGYNV